MGVILGLYWGYIGIMENRTETTIVSWGIIGIMENKIALGAPIEFCLGFRVWGLGLGFRVKGLGFKVWGLGLRVQDSVSGFRVGMWQRSWLLQGVIM